MEKIKFKSEEQLIAFVKSGTTAEVYLLFMSKKQRNLEIAIENGNLEKSDLEIAREEYLNTRQLDNLSEHMYSKACNLIDELEKENKRLKEQQNAKH